MATASHLPSAPNASRRPSAPALAVVGTAIVVLLIVLLSTRNNSASSDVASVLAGDGLNVTLAQTGSEPDGPIAEGGADELLLPAITYDVYLARDPFEPVVPEPEPEPEPGDVPPGQAPPVGTDPVPPGTDLPPGTPPSPGPDPTPPGTDPPAGTPPPSGTDPEDPQARPQVLEVTTHRDGSKVAIIQMGDVVYEVRQGETFAGSYRLLDFVDGNCVRILHGDVERRECAGGTLK